MPGGPQEEGGEADHRVPQAERRVAAAQIGEGVAQHACHKRPHRYADQVSSDDVHGACPRAHRYGREALGEGDRGRGPEGTDDVAGDEDEENGLPVRHAERDDVQRDAEEHARDR